MLLAPPPSPPLKLVPSAPSRQVGDVQHFYFREGDPPPFYKPGLAPSEYVGKAKGMALFSNNGRLRRTSAPSRF